MAPSGHQSFEDQLYNTDPTSIPREPDDESSWDNSEEGASDHITWPVAIALVVMSLVVAGLATWAFVTLAHRP